MKSILMRRVERLETERCGDDEVERARQIVRACGTVEFHPEQATDEDKALVGATTKDQYMDALVVCWKQPGAFVAAVEASVKKREQRSAHLPMVEGPKPEGEE